MNNSIWNTCIGEAIRKAKLSSTLIPLNEVEEIISELEKLKRTTTKEPEAVHGNEAEMEVLNDFISEIEKEFSDHNWEYLHFIAERVLENRSK